MKRFICLLLGIVLLFSLASCGILPNKKDDPSSQVSTASGRAPENDAEQTVANFLDAFIACEFDQLGTYTKYGEPLEIDMPDEEILQSFVEMVTNSTSYELVYSTITGDSATVTVKIKMVNLVDFVADFGKSLLGDAVLQKDLSQEAITKKFYSAVNAADRKQMEFDCPFLLEKIDGKWLLTDSDAFINAFEEKIKEGNIFDLITFFN